MLELIFLWKNIFGHLTQVSNAITEADGFFEKLTGERLITKRLHVVENKSSNKIVPSTPFSELVLEELLGEKQAKVFVVF